MAPAADRHRRFVLGRPADPRQDHRRRRVSRRAGDRPGAIPARDRRDGAGRRGRRRSTSTGRWRRSAAAVAVSGQDAAVADRADDRGARHRPRQIAERLDRGEGLPRLSQEPSDLLRRPGQDPGRAMPPARSARRRPGGWTPMSTVPGRGRLAGDARQGQPLAAVREACASMAASISARSAARRRGSRRTASARSRCWNIPSSAWKRCGASRS